MAERTRNSSHTSSADFSHYSERDLETALNDFLKEQQPPEKTNLFNGASIFGFAMLFVTTLYLVQQLIPWFGPTVSDNLIHSLPLIGGILVTLTGLGFFVGNKKPKKIKKADVRAAVDSKTITLDELNEKYKLDEYALNQNKRLIKSRSDRRIFGVCGGLAKYLGLGSFGVRLLWAIATLSFAPVMLPLYFILAVIMPSEQKSLQRPTSNPS